MTIVKHLSNYDTSFPNWKSNKGSLHDACDSQPNKIDKSKSKGADKGVSSYLPVSSSFHVSTKKKSKTLAYFFCQRPHKVMEIPQKAALIALQA